MKLDIRKILMILILLNISFYNRINAQLLPVLGGQRAGISTMQFLKIGVGGRAVGLGETFVAIANDASALYWNPAGIVQFNEQQAIFSHTEWVADIKTRIFLDMFIILVMSTLLAYLLLLFIWMI